MGRTVGGKSQTWNQNPKTVQQPAHNQTVGSDREQRRLVHGDGARQGRRPVGRDLAHGAAGGGHGAQVVPDAHQRRELAAQQQRRAPWLQAWEPAARRGRQPQDCRLRPVQLHVGWVTAAHFMRLAQLRIPRNRQKHRLEWRSVWCVVDRRDIVCHAVRQTALRRGEQQGSVQEDQAVHVQVPAAPQWRGEGLDCAHAAPWLVQEDHNRGNQVPLLVIEESAQVYAIGFIVKRWNWRWIVQNT